MHRIYKILALVLVLSFPANAQTKRVLGGPISIRELTSSKGVGIDSAASFVGAAPATDDDEEALVSGRAYASIVGERFSYLITGDKDMATLGNFASINVATATATVAFGGILAGKKNENGNILFASGSASGSADQNIISLFSADKFNSSFEARGTLSCISPFLGTKFFFEDHSWDKQESARRNAYSSLAAQRYRYFIRKRTNATEQKALDSIEASSEHRQLDLIPIEKRTAQQLQRFLDYQTKRTKLNADLQRQTNDAERFESNTDFVKAVNDTVFTVDKKATWSSIRLGWVDLFASGKLQKVNLYDGAASYFAQRLTESRELYHKVGLAYNLSWFSEEYGPFFNGVYRFEIAYSKSNNTSDLTPFEVTTEQKADSSNFSRKAAKKVNSYEKSQFAISDYLDYRIDVLKEVTRDHRAYLRFIYNYSVPVNQTVVEGKTKTPNTHNVTLGYLINFNNKDRKQANLNLQPYIKFRDFTNEYQSTLSLMRRSEIGILTVFPLGLTTPKD